MTLTFSFSFFASCTDQLQELLDRYVLMEQYYMKESVAKAMTMDLKEPDSLTRWSDCFSLNGHAVLYLLLMGIICYVFQLGAGRCLFHRAQVCKEIAEFIFSRLHMRCAEQWCYSIRNRLLTIRLLWHQGLLRY